ncbi:MAG: hypothetical protein PHI31_12705 [Desulfuromonadaceae bacterium]|nr:hypothetical protein [Desulfuromonadaceae bacterium]
MKRTAHDTARSLITMYFEVTNGDSYTVCRLKWSDLRSIAGVPKLTGKYLYDLNHSLNCFDFTLIQFDDCIIIEKKLPRYWFREFVSPDVVSKYIPVSANR